jgi:hypothetical protein
MVMVYMNINEKLKNLSQDFIKKPGISRLPNISRRSGSEPPEGKKKCLSLLHSIENLCDSYEQLPIIEFDREDSENSESIQTPPNKVFPVQDSKLNFIISQLKLRIKSYPMAQTNYPSSNRFKIVSETEEKVGPGTYRSPNLSQLETYEFSNLPRLHTPIAHTMNVIESLYKKKSDNVQDSIIQKNKIFAKDPEKLKKEFIDKINCFKIKEKNAKAKKNMLDQKKNLEKIEKFNEKTRKFEWRMTKEKVVMVKNTWSTLIVCIAMKTIFIKMTRIKTVQKVRWGKILRKFVVVIRCVGKFLIKLLKIRKRKVSDRINYLFVPFDHMVKNDIIYKKKIIDSLIEKSRDLPLIIHVMSKWKRSISLIQKTIRNAKKVNGLRKYVVGLIWDKLIEESHKAKVQEKIRRSPTVDRLYLMPSAIKEKFIRKYINSSLLSYANLKHSYAQTVKILKKAATPEKPFKESSIKRPVLLLYTQKPKLIKYIETANAYKSKLEKRQRDAKYNTQIQNDLNKLPS